ncbi:peptidoglycan recognition protein family protein, partial [Corynebacterium stationis]
HHNAGVLSIDQIWQVWQDRQASAHYQITTTGEIGQLVWDRDTAWHAANQHINQTSIGLEFSNSAGANADWPITDKTIEEGAHLVAAICKYYKLGRPQVGKNVRFHREFTSTSCPYHLAPGGKYHATLMGRAQFWYDQMTGKAAAKPAPAKKEGLSMSDIEELKKYIDQKAAENRKHLEAWLKGFVGPIGGDVKDVRQQVTGGRDSIAGDLQASYPGWDVDALVNVAEDKIRAGQGLTTTEMLALAAYDALSNSAFKDGK